MATQSIVDITVQDIGSTKTTLIWKQDNLVQNKQQAEVSTVMQYYSPFKRTHNFDNFTRFMTPTGRFDLFVTVSNGEDIYQKRLGVNKTPTQTSNMVLSHMETYHV